MFFTMNAEMAKKFVELQKQKNQVKVPTYQEYYNKRFLEECKFFVENPKFSMKYMMMMSYLQQTIKEKTIKEYKEKYPGHPMDTNIYKIAGANNANNDANDDNDNESVISDYDVIDDNDTHINEKDESEESKEEIKPVKKIDSTQTKQIRRSSRLKTKTSYN